MAVSPGDRAQSKSRTSSSSHSEGDLLARLPDTVLVRLFEFVGDVSKHDLCSVSRLNMRYHLLADAILYQTIRFLTPELHLVFSEGLSRRPRRGSAIKGITLAYPASNLSRLISKAPIHGSRNSQHYPPLPFDSLSQAIATMSNLEVLDIEVPDALLHGIGQLFNGPFDLACLKSCTLFYQNEDGQYWDLRENIHIFAHPTLETLTIRRAKLDHRGFDLIERPHETALSTLRLVECDINDDGLSDLLMFPKALKEFVMTQGSADDLPELEESSDSIRNYISALSEQSHSLESLTIDFPSLRTTRALALRDFVALETLRLNWDHQLFGISSKKPRLHSVGLPPELKTLEFLNELGTDEEVTDLMVYMIHHLPIMARKLETLVAVKGEGGVSQDVLDACRSQPQLTFTAIESPD